MKDGTLEIDLNHPIDDRFGAYFQIRLLSMYSFCRSAKSRKIYLMVTRRTKTIQNLTYLAGSLVFLGLVIFFPLRWYWLILLWMISSGLFCVVIHREIVKSRRQVQFYPPMVIDPIRRTISFYRRRDLSCFQINGEKQTFHFDQICKIKNSPYLQSTECTTRVLPGRLRYRCVGVLDPGAGWFIFRSSDSHFFRRISLQPDRRAPQ